MWLTLDANGGTARIRPTGKWRFFILAVLAFWLCGWAVGQVFFMGLMVAVVQEWVAPGTLSGVRETAVYLVVETLFATAGLLLVCAKGAAVWRNVLWLLWSEERLTITRDGVTRWWRLGPWRSERHLTRAEVLDVEPDGPGKALMVILTSGRQVELARAGTEEERRALAEKLRAFFRLAQDPEDIAALTPAGWESEAGLDGTWTLRTSRQVRGRKALRWGSIALFFGAGAALLAGRLHGDGADVVGNHVLWGLTALSIMAGGMAARGWYMFEQWEVQKGSCVDVSRGILGLRHKRFSPARFSVVRDMDSEGSALFHLWVQSPDRDRCLLTSLRVPRAPLHLGLWFSIRARVPLQLEPPDLRSFP